MISINMGQTNLLKAEPAGAHGVFTDLVHGIQIKDDLCLASLFGSDEKKKLIEAQRLWLDIYGGASPRRLEVIYECDGEADGIEEDGAFVIDEYGSAFDIHDVTIGQLLSPAA